MTMTVEQLTTARDSRRERIRELTETEQQLSRSLAAETATITTAVARGHSEKADDARLAARSLADRLGETRGAIAFLNRERATLEGVLEKAQAREAEERANQSFGAALSAVGAVDDALHEAAKRILALAHEADRAIGEANTYEAQAASLNGRQYSGIGRAGWHAKPGLRDLAQEIESYVRRQDIRIA